METGRLEERTVGGERVRLHAAGRPDDPGVAVFHAWWGLNDDVVAYADRLAGAGFCVRAPDLVRGRTATTVAEAERLSSGVDTEHANAVALSVADELTGPRGAAIGAVGFSMGVPWAVWCAAKRPAVAASVVYYGTLSGPSLTQAAAPVLGHFSEQDPYEPDDAVAAFERTLREAGREVVMHRYPGTGHWFAEPSRDAWRPEAADLAFDRTVRFLRRHLGGRPS